MFAAGIDIPVKQQDAMWKIADKNQSGYISYREFAKKFAYARYTTAAVVSRRKQEEAAEAQREEQSGWTSR